MNVIQNSEQFE